MYQLAQSYGKKAFAAWREKKSRDLRDVQSTPEQANDDIWEVHSYKELIEGVAFLGSMNKRLTLFYRGQHRKIDPVPSLFRGTWSAFDTGESVAITPENRELFLSELNRVGERVYDICSEPGLDLARRQGLRDIKEVQWAVIQHYLIWPTPLLDLTSNLRVAASFAMSCARAGAANSISGFVYVVGLPHTTGSISYHVDQDLVLSRLQSACPPIAKRPHYQDGFLVGRFPLQRVSEEKTARRNSLVRRLVAIFKLCDSGEFWDDDFPPIGSKALLPTEGPLRDRFVEEFGAKTPNSLAKLAHSLASSGARPAPA